MFAIAMMATKKTSFTFALVPLCVLLFCGCTKQSACVEDTYFLWDEYNTVGTVTCYLSKNINNLSKDTIYVKGYLNESFAPIEESLPYIYLSDKPVGFGGGVEIPRLTIATDAPITSEHRNKLLYAKGIPYKVWLDGYFVELSVLSGDIDSIMLK